MSGQFRRGLFVFLFFASLLLQAKHLARAVEVVTIQPANRLHVGGKFFRDSRGRVVILRGVNLAGNSKVPPFLPLARDNSGGVYAADPSHYQFVDHTDFGPLAKLPGFGINVIRLVFIWEAYEPIKGKLNKSYLDMIQRTADVANKLGIYTIVDFHQDVYSRFRDGGCGDGFPEWTTGLPRDVPANDARCKHWMDQALLNPIEGLPVSASFRDFYENSRGVRSAYMKMIESVANKLSHQDGLVGYDLLNEPFSDPLNFESELSSLYKEAAPHIRSQDKHAILFLEPNLLSDIGKQTSLTSRPVEGDIVYAPHFYDSSIAFTNRFTNSIQTELAFKSMQQISHLWNAPLFVGEFGAKGDTAGAAEYLDLIYTLLDKYSASGEQWNLTPAWKDGPKDEPVFDGWNQEDFSIVRAGMSIRPELFHKRPYPQKISGAPERMRSTSRPDGAACVDLVWSNDPALSGGTEFFFPSSDPVSHLIVNTHGSSAITCRQAENHESTIICKNLSEGRSEVTLATGLSGAECLEIP
jgi:endoglycosylceramidase